MRAFDSVERSDIIRAAKAAGIPLLTRYFEKLYSSSKYHSAIGHGLIIGADESDEELIRGIPCLR